jgi:hypothetical protein
MARKLQHRLALAHFKAKKGWEDLALDLIEPKIDDELRRKRPSSSGDILSDSSSSASDFQYPRGLMSSSPLKAPFFSDGVGSSSSSSSHRKRTYHTSFHQSDSLSSSHKRYRLSPTASRSFNSNHTSWKDQHQLAQSSPIKPRKHSHFTTSAGPNISLFRGSSANIPVETQINYMAGSDEDDDLLPMHSFRMTTSMNLGSSPPRTPPSNRARTGSGRQHNSKATNGRSGQEGADLLLYLATSPSPANPTGRSQMRPPSTPPPRNLALPSSMMTTPGGTGLISGFGGPNTPSQAFDFADFVNITPSPAQGPWPKTPRTAKTPLTVGRRRLTFDSFPLVNGSAGFGSPDMSSGAKPNGLGMQLGGHLKP